MTAAAGSAPRAAESRGGLAAIPIPDQAAPPGAPGTRAARSGSRVAWRGPRGGGKRKAPRTSLRDGSRGAAPRPPAHAFLRRKARETQLETPHSRLPRSWPRPGLEPPPVSQSVSQSVWRSPSRRGAPGRQEAEALRPRTTDATPRLRVPGRPLASASSGRAAHSAPTPRTSLPRTPAASATYCLKPRPPPRPALGANGRAPRRSHHVVARAPPAAPSVSDSRSPRTTRPRMPRGSAGPPRAAFWAM